MSYQASTSIASMASHERPQERLEALGPRALSDAELLALILRSGTQSVDVLTLARDLVSEAGSLARLLQLSIDDFKSYPGVGRVKAVQLSAILEIARRVSAEQSSERPIVDTADAVWRVMRSRVMHLEVEKFFVLLLNRKNRLIRVEEITSGTATSSLVHAREVFRSAIKASATAVICVHNHPSGDPSPSAQDIRCTRELRQAAEILDMDLLDHVVLGQPGADPRGQGFYSFADAGIL